MGRSSDPVRAGRRSTFSTLLLACVAVVLALGTTASGQNGGGEFVPGAAGAGDPYFPLDGNGGYDVRHYDLEVKYDPAADLLEGKAKLRATATQNLSSFNLDLVGLTVHSVVVNGRRAFWSREGGELTIAPERGLPEKQLHRRRPLAAFRSRSRAPASCTRTTERSSSASRTSQRAGIR